MIREYGMKVAGISAVLATALQIIGIWTRDTRWMSTAGVFAGIMILSAFLWGCAKMEEDVQ